MMDLSRRRILKSAAIGLFFYEQSAFADLCKKNSSTVSVGGVVGFDSLANPGHSRLFRQTCRASLYVHGYIWERINKEEQKAVLAAFHGMPIDVELGMVDDPTSWFKHGYIPKYIDAGIKAQHAHVNGFTSAGHSDLWHRFVVEARSHGITTIAPIFAPNSGQYVNAPFSSEKWNFLRDGAKLGGGLTIDSPPHFFLSQPESYRKFIIDELSWANSSGLYSTFIISPNKSGAKFLEETKHTVDFLNKNNALPKAWIVENYDPKASPNYRNRIGSENDSETILGVAFWLAQNSS